MNYKIKLLTSAMKTNGCKYNAYTVTVVHVVHCFVLRDCFSQISTNKSTHCVLMMSRFCHNILELRVFQGSVRLTEFLCGEGLDSMYCICIIHSVPLLSLLITTITFSYVKSVSLT